MAAAVAVGLAGDLVGGVDRVLDLAAERRRAGSRCGRPRESCASAPGVVSGGTAPVPPLPGGRGRRRRHARAAGGGQRGGSCERRSPAERPERQQLGRMLRPSAGGAQTEQLLRRPTGLADGLALKEPAPPPQQRWISPKTWFPRPPLASGGSAFARLQPRQCRAITRRSYAGTSDHSHERSDATEALTGGDTHERSGFLSGFLDLRSCRRPAAARRRP